MRACRPVRDRTEQQLAAAARQQSHLLESLRGMQSLKVAGEESQRRATYDNLMTETVNQDVIHSSHKLVLRGESMRKRKGSALATSGTD